MIRGKPESKLPSKLSLQGASLPDLSKLIVGLQDIHRLHEETISSEVTDDEFRRLVVSLSINAWRLHRKLINKETREPLPEMKRLFRHSEAMLDALKESGIEINDYEGRSYDPGMALKVISFEPTSGIQEEEIIEAIKPTIIARGKLLQVGEVVVGRPISTNNGSEE